MRRISLLLFAACSVSALGQMGMNESDGSQCPMHQQHLEEHAAEVQARGDRVMGFAHASTTHHFRTRPNGGVIEVTANYADDKQNVAAIRQHLEHIAVMFGHGDFSTPLLIHGVVPAGVTTMQLLKEKIIYRYQSLPSGGVVKIETKNPIAVAAIHDFLRFQIAEHRTGDAASEQAPTGR